MTKLLHTFTVIFITITIAIKYTGGATLLEQLNFLASQNQYTTEMLKAQFSAEQIMTSSMELALENCQNTFKWQRWNCPSADFFLRRTSRSLFFDREDIYVAAITTAAILYTITKDCSSGVIESCGCMDNSINSHCSDNPEQAEKLYNKYVSSLFSKNFYGCVRLHNYHAITKLMSQSLVTQCGCTSMGPSGCQEETCLDILKPFKEIAKDIREMYDQSIQLSNNGENSKVIWSNIPMDTLIYTKESPNYCEPDAILHWNGMRGRQCGHIGNKQASQEERKSCRNLCRACGYQVLQKNVITEQRCNCKFVWGFNVQCEVCVSMERQYYCY